MWPSHEIPKARHPVWVLPWFGNMYFSGWYQDGARPLAYSRHHLNPRHNPRVLFDFQSEVNVKPLVRCTKKMAGQILNMIFYGDSADENDDEWSRRQDLESTNVPKQNDTIEGKHWFWNKDVWNIFPAMLAQVVGGSYVRSRMHSWLPTGWATKFGPDSLKIPDRWMVWPSLSEILAEKYRPNQKSLTGPNSQTHPPVWQVSGCAACIWMQ